MKTFLMMLLLSPIVFGYPKDTPSRGLDSAVISAVGQPEYKDELFGVAGKYVEIKLTSAQVKTLNTTPILAVTTPASGYALVPTGVLGYIDYTSATWVSNSNNPITLEYGGSGTGNIALSITDSKLMELTADGLSYTYGAEVNPTADRALYAHVSGGNPTVGDSPIWLRIYYKVVPSALNLAQ